MDQNLGENKCLVGESSRLGECKVPMQNVPTTTTGRVLDTYFLIRFYNNVFFTNFQVDDHTHQWEYKKEVSGSVTKYSWSFVENKKCTKPDPSKFTNPAWSGLISAALLSVTMVTLDSVVRKFSK